MVGQMAPCSIYSLRVDLKTGSQFLNGLHNYFMENSKFLLATLEKSEFKRRFSIWAERAEQLQMQSHHTLGAIIWGSFLNLQNIGGGSFRPQLSFLIHIL